MASPAISRFPVVAVAESPADIQQRISEVEEKAGFVPNVFRALAWRPDEFRAFFQYHDALMDKESPGLSMAEREMIVVATSARNQCQYCVIAHGALVRIRARNPRLADQLASNYRKAEITPRQLVMLDFAVKVAWHAEDIDDQDFARLRDAGFDDDDIWDIGAISAFFGLSNRLANMMSLRANDEFYLMGRVPREK